MKAINLACADDPNLDYAGPGAREGAASTWLLVVTLIEAGASVEGIATFARENFAELRGPAA